MRRTATSTCAGTLAALLVALLAGCGEVTHCEAGAEPGCRNAAPRADGGCLFDLVAYDLGAQGVRCLQAGSEEDPCKACPDGTMCVPEEGRCAPFCDTPPMLPGSGTSPPAIFCAPRASMAAPLAFEEVCRRRCQLECQRIGQLCEAGCAAGSCDRPEVQAACARDCPTATASGERDLACLVRSCEDERLSRCSAELVCPSGSRVDCTRVSCTNDCAFADDGHCDDGDVFASERNDCKWGSDCADCGVRHGAPARGLLGNLCRYHGNCAGGTQQPSTAAAWCIASASLPGLSRCMPDCSRGQPCADGFECREVLVDTVNGPAPVIEAGRTAHACVPLLCM